MTRQDTAGGRVVWRDVTSYSRSDERIPRSYQANVSRLCLSVSHHIHHPGQWVLTCEPFFYQHEIGATTHPAAVMQAHALDLVSREVELCRAALKSAGGE